MDHRVQIIDENWDTLSSQKVQVANILLQW